MSIQTYTESGVSKEVIIRTVNDVVQQKTAITSLAGGVGAATTSFVDGINPYIPVISMVTMITFGAINVWINWRNHKANNGE